MNAQIGGTWVSVTESAARAAAFDNTQSFSDGSRLLTDVLAERYIEIPPDGHAIAIGMLPPQEMQVRAALLEASLSFQATTKIGFFSQLFGTARAKKANNLYEEKLQALAKCIRLSREHGAASKRIMNSYPGVPKALLEQAEQLTETKSEQS